MMSALHKMAESKHAVEARCYSRLTLREIA